MYDGTFLDFDGIARLRAQIAIAIAVPRRKLVAVI
jgi:hypothetical protein